MNSILSYLLESGICLLAFLLIYQVFLKRETFYSLNRAFLLFAISFSVIVPLLKITVSSASGMALVPAVLDPVNVSASGNTVIPSASPGILQIISGIYLLAVVVFVSRLIWNIRRINRLYILGLKKDNTDYKLVIHHENHPPFSFFRTIFINHEHYSAEPLDDIIEHERAHVRQLHSLDILFTEILIILQWFNPFAWIYKKLITENHEFLADEAVLNRGFNPDAYQLRILAQLFGIRSMPAALNFNQSITKKRLKMIEKQKSPSMARLKFLLVIPAALFMFYMFACSSVDTEMSAQDALNEESPVYLMPDIAAEYPGGFIALRKFIAQNLRYPEAAKTNGVEGKVYIQFIVDENGKVVSVVESSEPPPPPPPAANQVKQGEDAPPPPETIDIDGIVVVGYKPPEGLEQDYSKEDVQLLCDEAIRVIKEIPETWTPGMKDGKSVKTAWTIPINFILQSK